MNRLQIISLSTILLGLGAVSCEDVLKDNVNPDKAHEITAEVGLPTVVFYAQQTVYDHSDYYIYLSQCLTTGKKSDIGSYSYKCEWEFLTMNRHPQWRRHFYDIGVNVRNMIENSQSINSPNYELIGRTIRLLSTQLTTDAFGDMPLSNAYVSNTPSYDTQASIYAWMFQEADELIAMYENPEIVNSPSNYKITAKQDRVYAGDLSKWKGLVYAVKARLLLRNLPNVNTSAAVCDQIIATADKAIQQWRSGDLLYGAWFGNEPRYNFDGGTIEQSCVWSSQKPAINTWESRKNLLDSALPSKYFMVDCLGLLNSDNSKSGIYNADAMYEGYANDPRMPLLMIAREGPTEDKTVKMRYLENNVGMSTSYKVSNYPNLYMGAYAGSASCYNPIFTMEELYFIKAEAEYWKGNKAEACALAKESTEHNIERHLDFFLAKYTNESYNSTKDNKYPGASTTSGPGFIDAEQWNAQVNAFLNNEEYSIIFRGKPVVKVRKVSDRGNKHFFFSPADFSLSDLMIQKYIAMYMQPEQWTDMRRYHYSNGRNAYGIGDANEIVYPNLRRPFNLYAPYWVDGLTEAEKENTWIQRINYDPETEEKYNRQELERLGAYKNYKWLQKPMIWALERGQRTSLTAE